MRKIAILLALIAPLVCAQGKKKIVAIGVPPEIALQLQAASPDVDIVAVAPSNEFRRFGGSRLTGAAREEALRQIVDADALIGSPNVEMVRAAKKLKWVQVPSAGVEHLMFPEMVASDIVVTNLQKIASAAIADHAMALLLGLTRQLNEYIPARERSGELKTHLLELQGMKAVVIGAGGIGSNVAVRAWAAGMHVTAVDPRDISPSPFIERAVFPDRLDSVLPDADVVFICAPNTPKSRGMMGPKQFDLMKKGSFFIAVSRGAVYNMDALVTAISSGRLAGAGVDVTVPEPLPKDHPLWKLPNVIVTPHIATESQNELGRQVDLIKENIARFAKGEPLKYVVDKSKGY